MSPDIEAGRGTTGSTDDSTETEDDSDDSGTSSTSTTTTVSRSAPQREPTDNRTGSSTEPVSDSGSSSTSGTTTDRNTQTRDRSDPVREPTDNETGSRATSGSSTEDTQEPGSTEPSTSPSQTRGRNDPVPEPTDNRTGETVSEPEQDRSSEPSDAPMQNEPSRDRSQPVREPPEDRSGARDPQGVRARETDDVVDSNVLDGLGFERTGDGDLRAPDSADRDTMAQREAEAERNRALDGLGFEVSGDGDLQAPEAPGTETLRERQQSGPSQEQITPTDARTGPGGGQFIPQSAPEPEDPDRLEEAGEWYTENISEPFGDAIGDQAERAGFVLLGERAGVDVRSFAEGTGSGAAEILNPGANLAMARDVTTFSAEQFQRGITPVQADFGPATVPLGLAADPEGFDESRQESTEAVATVASNVASSASANPERFAGTLVGGAVGGTAAVRGVGTVARSARTGRAARGSSGADDALDLSGPATRARNRVSSVRNRVSQTRDRAPDVSVRLDSDSSLVEVSPLLRQQVREAVSERAPSTRPLSSRSGTSARQLGRESRLAQARVRNAASDARTGAELAVRSRADDLPSRGDVSNLVPDRPEVGFRNPTGMSARQLGRESRLAQARVRNTLDSARTGAELAVRSGLEVSPRRLGRQSRLAQARVRNRASDIRTGAELAARSRADDFIPEIPSSPLTQMSAQQLGRESRLVQARVGNTLSDSRTGVELSIRSRADDIPRRSDVRNALPGAPSLSASGFAGVSRPSASSAARRLRLAQGRAENALSDARVGGELAVRSALDDVEGGLRSRSLFGGSGIETPTISIGPVRPRRTDARFSNLDEGGSQSSLASGLVDDDSGGVAGSGAGGRTSSGSRIQMDVRNTRRNANQRQQTVTRMQQLEPDRPPRSGLLDRETPRRSLRDAGLGGSLAGASVGELNQGSGSPSASRLRETQATSVDAGTNTLLEEPQPIEPQEGTRSQSRLRSGAGVTPRTDATVGTSLTSATETVNATETRAPVTTRTLTPGTSRRPPRLGIENNSRDRDDLFDGREGFSSVLERDLINPFTGE